MPAAAWMTLIVAALIIAVTAVGLLRVIFHLRAIRATLVQVTGGVQAVAAAHQPGAAPADGGQREPQAGSRLLRDGVRSY